MTASSLAAQLSQLVDSAPHPELDPEAAGMTENEFHAASDDELAELVAGAANGRRSVVADISLNAGQYEGRRSSRSAFFGSQGAIDSDTDGSGSEGDLVPASAVHVHHSMPFIDYATVPTMFVNGHLHGPGPDDPTTSSSMFEESDEGEEASQQQQYQTTHEAQHQAQQQHENTVQVQTPDSTLQEGLSNQGFSEQQQLQEGLPSGAQGLLQQLQAQVDQSVGEQGTAEVSREADTTAGAAQHGQTTGHSTDVPTEEAAAATATAVVTATALLGDDDEMQELEREAAAAQAEAAAQLVATAAHSSKDAAKAAGVRAQQRLWGAALELRIRLQKAVSGSQVLPRSQAAAAFRASQQQVASGYSTLLSSCQSTLEELLQLHSVLAQQHPAAAAAVATSEQTVHAQSHKRSRDAAGLDAEMPPMKYSGRCSSAAAAWAAVDEAIEGLAGFRDAALDKWHRRTVLSSGTAALRGSSGLRALQQSVSKQVAALLADKQKLVSRSQLPRQLAPRPLGQAAVIVDSSAAAEGAASDNEAPTAAGGGVVSGRDPETYDEGDFYQQLLKELIESAPGGLSSQLAAARPAKRRKVVDRRASKGRKIRYHTLDKLVGFMAPSELVTPPFAEQLFANLFTHHTYQ